MYRRLLPFVNKFILVRQGLLNRAYMGRLLNVDEHILELQMFNPDGLPTDVWVLSLSTITEYMTRSRQLDTLALRVKWASSEDFKDDAPENNDNNDGDNEEDKAKTPVSSH